MLSVLISAILVGAWGELLLISVTQKPYILLPSTPIWGYSLKATVLPEKEKPGSFPGFWISNI